MIRQMLERKSTYQDHIDVGLFWLPGQNEYVTWLINKQFEDHQDHGTCNGHYYLEGEFESAKKDYDKRG